jgi:hypothetical protein
MAPAAALTLTWVDVSRRARLSAQSTRLGATRSRRADAAVCAAPWPAAAPALPDRLLPRLPRHSVAGLGRTARMLHFFSTREPACRGSASFEQRLPPTIPGVTPLHVHARHCCAGRAARRPSRPGSWPLSPSESAGLGWGGPHSLRWEGGSALALHPRPSPSSRAVTHAALCGVRIGPAPRHLPFLCVLAHALAQLPHLRRARRAQHGREEQRVERGRFARCLLDRHDAAAPRAVKRHLLARTTARALACTRVHARTHARTARHLRGLQRSRRGAPRTTLLSPAAQACARKMPPSFDSSFDPGPNYDSTCDFALSINGALRAACVPEPACYLLDSASPRARSRGALEPGAPRAAPRRRGRAARAPLSHGARQSPVSSSITLARERRRGLHGLLQRRLVRSARGG